MDDNQTLIAEIEKFCRDNAIAESTFGRRAVNDGKFVGRLRLGRGITTRTVNRVRTYIAENGVTTNGTPANGHSNGHSNGHHNGHSNGLPVMPGMNGGPVAVGGPQGHEAAPQSFRFYDNRQKYLAFVNTCSEKWVIAERVGMELAQLRPQPPAIRVFDAGMGDGTVLSRVMRELHWRHPTIPLYIVGKEISLEDVRLSLEKVADRFFEHAPTVLVITNMSYAEAPSLAPGSLAHAAALNWHEVALRGNTAHEFDEQVKALRPILDEGWQVRESEKSGNLVYARPSVLVLYREDQKFIVDPIIPRPGKVDGLYDLVIASQPYRARASAEFKARRVLAPLARALAPGGRMLGIHSHGHDPGLEIIRSVWPDRDLGQTSRHVLMKEMKNAIGRSNPDLRFNTYADARALFRYEMHTLPTEITNAIGTSTLFAAWNAAIYVYQVEDEALAPAMADDSYLRATQEVLQKHGGLWFVDESYVVSRRR